MQPLMPKATAVWLVDNTTLTFDQIAEFTGMHPLEISGIADGEVAVGIKGFDPIANNQLTRAEIERCEKDNKARLKLLKPVSTPQPKKKAPRYTPLSKRQDRPAAIAWLVRNHPELADAQITKLLGTTKQTIEAIRNKSHWNSANIQPVDPVALGLCTQMALDEAVRQASERRAAMEEAAGGPIGVAADESLMPTEDSLAAENPAMKKYEGLEDVFDAPQAEPEPEEETATPSVDPEAFFNLPKGEGDAEEDGEPRP